MLNRILNKYYPVVIKAKLSDKGTVFTVRQNKRRRKRIHYFFYSRPRQLAVDRSIAAAAVNNTEESGDCHNISAQKNSHGSFVRSLFEKRCTDALRQTLNLRKGQRAFLIRISDFVVIFLR